MRCPAVRLAYLVLVVLTTLAVSTTTASGFERGDTLRVKATAYGGHQPTATGVKTRHGICAVDPDVIPLGTRFRVPGYGICLAADVGGAVKGRMIDVWLPTEGHTYHWGVRRLTIRFL